MIRFREIFKKVEQIGVRKSHAKSVVENPDKTEAVPLGEGEKEVNLYLKHVPERKPPSYMLVSAHETDDDTIINLAFPIPEHLLDPTSTPLQALHILTDHFGVSLRIGDQEGRLMIDRTGTLSGDKPTILQPLERVTLMAVDSWMNVSPDGGSVQIGLAYAIDLGKLSSELL